MKIVVEKLCDGNKIILINSSPSKNKFCELISGPKFLDCIFLYIICMDNNTFMILNTFTY